ncbi:ubiquitin carboxyl-terminal hydrolase 49 [Polypterus senegalus]|uniref:ubiquitin carboxyl-terminal hydrolase 49 n=1 Tax=Polypterus senegalus TaxID=55291 RepID=UPI001963AEDB|nr:ubiquitin carboxyl-terminal hydrolase 49 [Polypterus senegalus]XP_039620736.1 ubiquitin carboxyl-terminal hydrolase 49 [Polypterus senegalus]XP_039620737.1 ubiquitin carboxyl-terminal hydrolase 49 [Polypterus senegalus]
MDRCKHVGRLRLAQDHSILNPQKWHCIDCQTTESVWACLKCSHVACGRYIEEHALKHFQESRHPLAMEVHELNVFCYLCDDYVLNDNAEGDLKLLRGALSTVCSKECDPSQPVRRSLRSLASIDNSSHQQKETGGQAAMQTALWHRRQALLSKAMRAWFLKSSRGRQRFEEEQRKKEIEKKKEEMRQRRQEVKRRLLEELASSPPRKSARLLTQAPRAPIIIPSKFREPANRTPLLVSSVSRRSLGNASKLRQYYSTPKRQITPGVTGLRNLGNTCYMNSILQVLSHLQKFRECFLTLDLSETEELLAKTSGINKSRVSGKILNGTSNSNGGSGRHERLASLTGSKQGLHPKINAAELVQPKELRSSRQMSLCHELHTLFRVMWSGRWALVSPFAMLHSVWNLIPSFRGYDQQDAQEFLCELLDKVQQELESEGTKRKIVIPFSQRKLTKQVLKVVNTIFHGQLLSQVTCVTCNYKSNTVEPFWDLSLEFPERYHCVEKGASAMAFHDDCTLTEMLAKFTETEDLEGRIYACDCCNSKRRKSSPKPLVLTEACKQLLIFRLPQVLRLHLKRFRWSGRNHREKIGVHVNFDQVLNMEPYCCRDSLSSIHKESFTYDLSAVVMHHGKGFGSGHYTAYCYNTEGGFWVHCNDSKMSVCSVEEVCNTQAYILFYTQRCTPTSVA